MTTLEILGVIALLLSIIVQIAGIIYFTRRYFHRKTEKERVYKEYLGEREIDKQLEERKRRRGVKK